jgi:hypothetical protein
MNNQPRSPRSRMPIDPMTRKHPEQLDLRGRGTTSYPQMSRHVMRLAPLRHRAANVLDLRPVRIILTSPAPPLHHPIAAPQPLDSPQRQAEPAPTAQSKVAVADGKTNSGWLKELGLNTLIVVIALILAFSATAGQVIIGLYCLVVLFKRLDSRGPFILTLVMLVAIPIFQLINLTNFSDNAAIYAYELMVIGVAAAIIETWREERGITRGQLRGNHQELVSR